MAVEATKAYSNPAQRWQEMSRPSTTINRIKIAVAGVFSALGVAGMATGAAILATIGMTSPAAALLLGSQLICTQNASFECISK